MLCTWTKEQYLISSQWGCALMLSWIYRNEVGLNHKIWSNHINFEHKTKKSNMYTETQSHKFTFGLFLKEKLSLRQA